MALTNSYVLALSRFPDFFSKLRDGQAKHLTKSPISF